MNTRKTIYNITVVFWFISAAYLVYRFSLQAGYWENPLYVNLFIYILILILNKGFNKLTLYMILFYVGMVIWFLIDLTLIIGQVFSVN